MARNIKTYSVSAAAKLTGSHVQWIYRLCQDGIVGRKILIPTTGQHVYAISEKEIPAIKARKRQGFRQF